MTIATRVLCLYLAVTYLPQTALALIYPEAYAIEYRGYLEDIWLKCAFMLLIAMLLVLTQAAIRRATVGARFSINAGFALSGPIDVARGTISLVHFGLSIPFAVIYGISFFHAGLYLSELPPWVVILQALKPLVRLDLAYCTIKALRREPLSGVDRKITFVNAFASAISIAGAIDILFVALAAVLLVKRGTVMQQIFLGSAQRPRKGRLRGLMYMMIIGASLPAVAFIGFANKMGFERTFKLFQDGATAVSEFVVPLGLRLSSSHGSFIANAELPLAFDEQVEGLSYPLGNLAWRTCVLLVRDPCPERGDITHTARLNYVRSYQDQSPLKAGATPGLLATVLYFPFLPVSLLVIGAYCAIATSCIDRAVGAVRLNLFGLMLIVLFVFPLFENPIDLLVVFDPAVVYAVGLLVIFASFGRARAAQKQLHLYLATPPEHKRDHARA